VEPSLWCEKNEYNDQNYHHVIRPASSVI
jgi:hypothetical protein